MFSKQLKEKNQPLGQSTHSWKNILLYIWWNTFKFLSLSLKATLTYNLSSIGQLESVAQRLCLCPEGSWGAGESEREVKRNIHKPLLLFYEKCALRGTSPCRLIHQADPNTARTTVDVRLTTWHWQLVRHGCSARKGQDGSGDLSKNKQVNLAANKH